MIAILHPANLPQPSRVCADYLDDCPVGCIHILMLLVLASTEGMRVSPRIEEDVGEDGRAVHYQHRIECTVAEGCCINHVYSSALNCVNEEIPAR